MNSSPPGVGKYELNNKNNNFIFVSLKELHILKNVMRNAQIYRKINIKIKSKFDIFI
jgi:hypothetical protein